jgi:hypothetical protein
MDACVTVGRYLCLVKGRWDEGLALFVHGSSPALRILGEKASRRPTAPAQVAEIADLLWNWADEEKGSARAKLQARARSLYWQALPGILGLERTKAEDRLQTTFRRKVLVPGLVAEYFNDTSFNRRVKTRVDYQLNFDWSRFPPDPVVHHDNFGACWRGYLKPPRPGKYTLILASDNGSRLWLDGRVIFDRLDPNSTPRFSTRITLSDQPHRFAVEFLQGMLGAYIHLSWVPPGETVERPVPPEAFYHAREQEKVLHK